jgi:hypothetical protein
MAIKPDDLKRYVSSIREGGYKCSYCGNGVYSVMLQGKEDNSESATFHLSPLGTQLYFDFHGVSCDKCGNANLFSIDCVEAWLEENSAPKRSAKKA